MTTENDQFKPGDALCTRQDGAGKKYLTWAFAGSINEQPTQYSDTVEYNPNPTWSNGSDTRAIETQLRKTKKKLGYIENQVSEQSKDLPTKTPLTSYRDATRSRDRSWFLRHLGKKYMKEREIHHNWKKGGYPIIISHQEHVELHKQDGRWGGKRAGAGRPRKNNQVTTQTSIEESVKTRERAAGGKAQLNYKEEK